MAISTNQRITNQQDVSTEVARVGTFNNANTILYLNSSGVLTHLFRVVMALTRAFSNDKLLDAVTGAHGMNISIVENR
jgi:hypothetical protein